MFLFKRISLEKALEIYYGSDWKDIEVDRYLRVRNGVLFFIKVTMENILDEDCGHILVTNSGDVIGTNPLRINFNDRVIRKIPDKLKEKYKQPISI